MNTEDLTLGIIGSSEGNGHPYSWSAIINGYDKKFMNKCPFRAIPDYLSKHHFPEDQIHNAEVTHVWTQNRLESELISSSSKIPNIVDEPEDMIGEVDAILLARDDYKMHKTLAFPFLKEGMPIYIDKPLAINKHAAADLLDLQQYEGQIFTGSAIAWSPDIANVKESLNELGELKWIEGIVPGPWDKYSVHLIDPVLSLVGKMSGVTRINVMKLDDITVLQGVIENKIALSLSCVGRISAPFRFLFSGTKGEFQVEIDDVFPAFKASLKAFIDSIQGNTIVRSREEIMNSITWISKAASKGRQFNYE